MTYTVSFHPVRGWRWWPPDGPYRYGGEHCDTAVEQHVGDATPAETAVIKRIIAASLQNQPASVAARRFIELATMRVPAP